jgi:hypothetical protein
VASIEHLGEEPSPRKAENVCSLNSDGIEESCETIRPVVDPEPGRGVGRLTGARSVPCDDSELIRKACELRPPDPRVKSEPVQKNQDRTVTGNLVGH